LAWKDLTLSRYVGLQEAEDDARNDVVVRRKGDENMGRYSTGRKDLLYTSL
ncbi:6456_t:CDS:1, partial [Acaulospora colombiana]